MEKIPSCVNLALDIILFIFRLLSSYDRDFLRSGAMNVMGAKAVMGAMGVWHGHPGI